MTQEDKNLLFIDLCARLPYGVKIYTKENGKDTSFVLTISDLNWIFDKNRIDAMYDYDGWKPYLRPMSSMTEEEIKAYRTLQDTACSYHYEFGDIVDDLLYFDNDVSLDYLNSIHIDYRGLIPMGLALEAPDEMY